MNPEITTDILNLLHVPGIGPQRVRTLLSYYKDTRSIWDESETGLCQIEGINISIARSILDFTDFDFGKRQVEIAQKNNCNIVSSFDNHYPELLKRIYDPPVLLFTKGNGLKKEQDCIAIVGTRNMTEYGRRVTSDLSSSLSRSGLIIVSGLARGVDTIAHNETLIADGKTIAVLGCGLDRVYPSENRKLYSEIEDRGTLVSEFPFGTKPDAVNFPQRNRIISGLSHAVIVVEAGNKSGAMLTALNAIDQNRDVYAVPGRIYDDKSIGTNRLIRHGAIPVQNAEEIVTILQPRLFKPNQPKQERINLELNPMQAKIVAQLQNDAVHIDQLAKILNIEITKLLSELLQLELIGAVRQLAGKMFIAN